MASRSEAQSTGSAPGSSPCLVLALGKTCPSFAKASVKQRRGSMPGQRGLRWGREARARKNCHVA